MSSIQSKISYFIYSLDFLSGSTNFKIFDREKNVSLVGLIFTIILAIMTLFYATFEIINYFQQTNFSLISMEDNSEKIDATKYLGNETIAILRFYKYDTDEEENQIEKDIPDLFKIFKIEVQQYNYKYENDNDELIYYNMVNCTNYITNDISIKYNLPYYYIEQSVCPPNDKGIKLRWNKYELSELNFEVYLCNKDEDENCYSKEEIEEKYESGELDNIAFGFIQEFIIVDNNNYSYPITIDSLMADGDIDLNYYFIGESKSKYVHYESDNGIIFNNIKNYTGLRFDKFIRNYKNRENIFDYESPLLSISYSLNMNYLLNYKRIYVKLTTVIVDIFGIVRVLFLIGGYTISLISENYFSYKLFDEIFSQKYQIINQNKIKKNLQIHEDIISQNSSNKNMLKNNKINVYNIPENSNKIGNNLKIKKKKIKKGKIKKNNIINTNIILNEGNSDNTNVKIINKDSNIIKNVDNEKYSIILSKYLGYGLRDKKKFSFWTFICSQFNRRSNDRKIINSCVKIINNYLSLEQMINNCINIDILLAHNESQELNKIDIFNRIIDDDFRNTIKSIKEKKN